MRSKSTSLATILALTSAAADSFAPSSIEETETATYTVDVAEGAAPAAAGMAVSPAPKRTRRAGANGRRRLRRNAERLSKASKRRVEETSHQPQVPRRLERTTRQTANQSNTPAPGCGPSPGTHHSPYLGCYTDRSKSRAFPFELHENQSRIRRLGHGALDCERECSNRGYRFFGREFRGQCFCGDELESIVRYGVGDGCDCCGGDVGAGRMCVWENANHPDSQAQPPEIPVILPQHSQPASNQMSTAMQPMHTHIGSLSINSNNNQRFKKPTEDRNPFNSNNNNNNRNDQTSPVIPVGFTPKPVGGFRLRLHWQRGYNWQNSSREQFWCMECRGTCKSGSSIQIDKCNSSTRQKFIAVSRTIRPASNPSLCLTITGYGGTRNPVRLRHCNRGSDQDFREVQSRDAFELQSEANMDRCLSQHHHPKSHEAVFPEKCEKTRRFDTTYWESY